VKGKWFKVIDLTTLPQMPQNTKIKKKLETHHEVAYNTKTLAAFEIASRASFDTLTPSGICEKEIDYTYILHTVIHKTVCSFITSIDITRNYHYGTFIKNVQGITLST
jgi:hypothetical protein